jgi:hypothetical protein
MKSVFIPLALLSSSLASSSQTIEGDERTYTSFKIIHIDTNNQVLPVLPPNTPLDVTGVNTERALRKSAKRKRYTVVYYTEDWELEWLNFLKVILEEVQDVHPPCILEKRETYNARRFYSE